MIYTIWVAIVALAGKLFCRHYDSMGSLFFRDQDDDENHVLVCERCGAVRPGTFDEP